ncbi:MAG TPA: PKD domain-containing protein [Blastocatellia bacterium]|nr:PKD domain-containing protein [Blastocatellia bacterium]
MIFRNNTRRFSLLLLALAVVGYLSFTPGASSASAGLVGVTAIPAGTFQGGVSTTTTLNPISTPLTAGQTYSFSGQVSPINPLAPAVPDGRPVNLRLRSGGCTGSESLLASTTTTGGNGSFSGTFTAPSAGTWGLYASFPTVVTPSIAWVASASACQTITVNSSCTAPIVTITGPPSGSIYSVGTPVNFTGAFTDDAGDTHTGAWMFDDITQAATVVEPSGSIPGSADTTFTFTEAGVYTVTLTVTDNCGLSTTATTVGEFEALVVVYDPSAGWVTGGGWINSPEGAYAPDPSLAGKANFGFVSKYQPGASVPTGDTEFHFKAGNLKFKSASYEWLVVSGARAQYKGFGTINGVGDYRFMLTAIDGDQPGGTGLDKFRIRIWSDGGGLVYDNQFSAPDSDDPTTVLGGGSIQIHH